MRNLFNKASAIDHYHTFINHNIRSLGLMALMNDGHFAKMELPIGDEVRIREALRIHQVVFLFASPFHR